MRVIQEIDLETTKIDTAIYYYSDVYDLIRNSVSIINCFENYIYKDRTLRTIFTPGKNNGYEAYNNFVNYVNNVLVKQASDSIDNYKSKRSGRFDKVDLIKMPNFEPAKFIIGCYNIDIRYTVSKGEGLYVIINSSKKYE